MCCSNDLFTCNYIQGCVLNLRSTINQKFSPFFSSGSDNCSASHFKINIDKLSQTFISLCTFKSLYSCYSNNFNRLFNNEYYL